VEYNLESSAPDYLKRGCAVNNEKLTRRDAVKLAGAAAIALPVSFGDSASTEGAQERTIVDPGL